MAKQDISASDVLGALSYDPSTGEFRRRKTCGNCLAGSLAGTVDKDGYRVISLKRKSYFAHRLAWFVSHGSWPSFVVDHINGNKLDNRIENLRDVSVGVNLQNRRKASRSSASGILGVSWSRASKKWLASIQVDGKSISLGLHPTAEEASAAYMRAKQTHHAGAVVG